MTEHKYGQLISIDLLCEKCGLRTVVTMPRSQATYENRWNCDDCREFNTVKRVPSAPLVAKASYPDGYKRKGFQELKEANHLRTELAGLPGEERAKAEREIDRLEQRTSKGTK